MRITDNSLVRLLAATGIATSAFCATEDVRAQTISDRILSDVSAQTVGDCATLSIKFNRRFQLLSYFPQEVGRDLRVRIRFLDSSENGGRESFGNNSRESLRPPSGIDALRAINFEGNNGAGPTLSLIFKRDVHFSVGAGPTPDTLIISISENGASAVCNTSKLEVDDGVLAVGTEPTINTPRTATPSAVPGGLYVINLLSQPTDIGDLPAIRSTGLGDLLLYEARFDRDGQTWHRLRAGFFNSHAEAEAAMVQLRKDFPEAWVVKVTPQERGQGVVTSQSTRGGKATSSPIAENSTLASSEDIAGTAKAIADAETSIKAGENDRAVQQLTKALGYPANENTPRALELLGLSRERKNQNAQARAEYEEYLRRYPSGEGADRVRQRLASLDAPGATPTGPQLRNPTGLRQATKKGWRWGLRGSFSQFYFRDQTSNKFVTTNPLIPNDPNNDPVIDNAVNLNQLLTNADITLTGGNDRTQVLLRGAGSYTKSFRAKTPIKDPFTNQIVGFRSGDVKTLSALYFDFTDNVTNLSGRIGRQTRNSAGVLGRFDGALVGWQARPRVKFNVVAGTPVLRARDLFIRSDRYFYGASVDIGSRNDKFQTTVYWYDERSPGLVDRQALGAEARYLKGRFNAFAILDYDVHFSQLNLGLLTLNYTFKDESSFSVTADYRKSSLLNTWNAIQQLDPSFVTPGRTAGIEDLQDIRRRFSNGQIYGLALDNTLNVSSLTASYARPLTKKLQANLDFTATHTSGSPGSTRLFPGSTFLPATLSTGTEYYYGAQLVGSGMIFSNDVYILGGRYADTPRARTYTADINARIPVTSKFRLSPRARYGYRQDKLITGSFKQFQPTMRMNIYPFKQSEIEIEVGGSFSTQRTVFAGTPTTTTEKGLLLSAGYRLDF